MKVGIITSDSRPYVRILILYLIKNNIKPDSVILIKESFIKRFRRNFSLLFIIEKLNSILNGYKQPLPEAQIDFLSDFQKNKGIEIQDSSFNHFLAEQSVKLVKFNNSNSFKNIKYIKKRQLDILINAGGGIFRKGLIESLNIGILNTHMGDLPDFRGMNVLEWSLFYEREIGATLHFINQGIDKGDILLYKKIPINEGDRIDDLRGKSGIINLELYSEGIQRLIQGNVERKVQSNKMGKQYFVMHPRLREITERRLVNMFT